MKPIEPSIMYGTGFARTALSTLAAAALAACSSSTPPPEKPAPEYTQEESWGPGKREDPEPEGQTSSSPQKSTAVPAPDDYEMTNRDCIEVGRHFKTVIRNDEVAKLSPKLKQNQRDAAEASIDRAATTRQDQWIEGCQSSLVGKVVDRATLTCAMGTKSVKEFDACLNQPTGKSEK